MAGLGDRGAGLGCSGYRVISAPASELGALESDGVPCSPSPSPGAPSGLQSVSKMQTMAEQEDFNEKQYGLGN